MKLEIKKIGYMIQDRTDKQDRWYDNPESIRPTKKELIKDWDSSPVNKGKYHWNRVRELMRIIPVYKLFYGDGDPVRCNSIMIELPAGKSLTVPEGGE